MSQSDSIGASLGEATELLEKSGIDTARMDASLLLAHVLEMTRESVALSPDKLLTDKDKNQFMATIKRRAKHEPIAYITGKKEFWSLDFCVTRDTLIPRPDSETLIEAALRRVKNRASNTTILDIGTGTGCLLIALLKELPKASGVGVDINKSALQVAQENAQIHHVGDRAEFAVSHWGDALNRTFDLIISNPPYIPQNETLMADVVDFEPHAALFAGNDGLDAYRALAPQMKRLLNPDGLVVFEVGQHQAKQVNALLQAEGLLTEKPEQDLAGIERCVVARKPH